MGTWDQTNNPERAQFISGNNNIETLFNKNFEITMERIRRVNKSFVELSFVVTEEGKLDSVVFLEHSDKLNDFEAVRLLSMTDGAWRPGVIGDKRVREKIYLKYFFYDNAKTIKVDKIRMKAEESFKKNEFEKSFSFSNDILKVSPFDIEAIKIKFSSLIKLQRQEEACYGLESVKTYIPATFKELAASYCSKN